MNLPIAMTSISSDDVDLFTRARQQIKAGNLPTEVPELKSAAARLLSKLQSGEARESAKLLAHGHWGVSDIVNVAEDASVTSLRTSLGPATAEMGERKRL
jgi:hypothetical protein